MFNRRILTAGLCAALVLPVGCKKKEEPKKDEPVAAAAAAGVAQAGDQVAAAAVAAVAPALPDVELVAGDGVAAWVSFQSLGSLFDAAESIGGKLGLVPPGGTLRQDAYTQLSTVLASVGISGHEWLDKTKPIHLAFQDDAPAAPAPAAAGASPALAAPTPPNPGGAFAVLHVTDKDKTLAAMAAAKKGPEAEGHDAKLTLGDKSAYVDFIGTTMVLTSEKERFARIKAFVERLDKVEVPSLVYFGASIEDLVRTRQPQIDAFMAQLEKDGPGAGAGMAGMGNPQDAMKAYFKMIRQWLTDLARVEMLVGADVHNAKFEFRVTAKEGSKLYRQLMAGRGRTPKDITALLPGNSYLTFGASVDPAASVESIDDSMVMLKDMLKLTQPDYDAILADVKAAMKLQDGTSAMALYPDGASAVGMLVVAGTSDGEAAMKLTKRLVTTLIAKFIAEQKAQKKAADPTAKDDPMLAIVEQAVREGKVDPILLAFGPMAKEKGITLTANTTKEGDQTCEVLDVAMDWAKLGADDPDAAKAKLVIGDKTAISLCSAKTKMAMAFGPGALEHGKRAVAGTAGGLHEAPIYKQATEASRSASWLMYINPGMALAAFKTAFPEVPSLPGDKAAILACANRTRSFGCSFEMPIEMIAAIKDVASPGERPAPVEAAPPAGALAAPPADPAAPGPTGAPTR